MFHYWNWMWTKTTMEWWVATSRRIKIINWLSLHSHSYLLQINDTWNMENECGRWMYTWRNIPGLWYWCRWMRRWNKTALNWSFCFYRMRWIRARFWSNGYGYASRRISSVKTFCLTRKLAGCYTSIDATTLIHLLGEIDDQYFASQTKCNLDKLYSIPSLKIGFQPKICAMITTRMVAKIPVVKKFGVSMIYWLWKKNRHRGQPFVTPSIKSHRRIGTFDLIEVLYNLSESVILILYSIEGKRKSEKARNQRLWSSFVAYILISMTLTSTIWKTLKLRLV